MDREELLRRYAAGERDFSALKWLNIDLSGTTLHGVQFHSCGTITDLSEWSHVNLRNINWTQCNLDGCRFSFCDFRDARLFNCKIDRMFVTDCNMKRIRCGTPVGSAFIRVNFRGAMLGRNYHFCANVFTDCIREDGKFIRRGGEDPWYEIRPERRF